MFKFNKGFNITIIVLSFLIVSATAVLIAVFPIKFELIFGTGTFLFVSLGMFVSLQSLDTATGARADSEKSSLLKLHKDKMHIPLVVPFALIDPFFYK